jgi:hypothetical protein
MTSQIIVTAVTDPSPELHKTGKGKEETEK